jgi:hypothetical protein
MIFHKIGADIKQRALQVINKGWELAELEVADVSLKSVES